jgi:Transposase DDE domain
MQANRLWALWQALLQPFAGAFTCRGWRRFVEWITGLALNVEEHTITQSLLGLDRTQDWKAVETFAEVGHWKERWVEYLLAQQVETAPGRLWYGYHVDAVDDTKVHRSSKHVWGTCTFHEYTARCPNRASTVRAHNWVVVGALLHNPDQPAWFLPLAGELYFRKAQLPYQRGASGPREPFHTKGVLAVDLLRRQARSSNAKHLGIMDGAFAVQSVVRPLLQPPPGEPRIDLLTRLRQDARLYRLPPSQRRQGQRGPTPRWGRQLPPPRQGGRWPGSWRTGQAWIYGRQRHVRWKEVLCLWRVAGPEVVVKAVVARVEGYRKRFTLVTSATELSGLQVVELFCARFRQEDGFRDLKQRLGWEECRAWTKNPILRTTQALFVTMSLLRLLHFRLAAAGEDDWWLRPPWNPRKTRPSVLDLERLLRRHRERMQQLLAAWLEEGENDTGAAAEVVAM